MFLSHLTHTHTYTMIEHVRWWGTKWWVPKIQNCLQLKVGDRRSPDFWNIDKDSTYWWIHRAICNIEFMSAGISSTLHLCLWPRYLEPAQVKHCCPHSSLYCSKFTLPPIWCFLSLSLHCTASCSPISGIRSKLCQFRPRSFCFRPGAEEGVRFFFTPSLTRLAR